MRMCMVFVAREQRRAWIKDSGVAVVPESCVSLCLHLEVGIRGEQPRGIYVLEARDK